MSDDTDLSNVSQLPNAKGEYVDHEIFLDLVKDGIKEREVDTTIVLVLDKMGRHTFHSSTPNTERVNCMLLAALTHAQAMWAGALAELQNTGGDDSTPAA